MISMVVNLKKGGKKKEKKVQQQLDMYVRIGGWVQLIQSAALPRSEEGRGHSTHSDEKGKKKKKKNRQLFTSHFVLGVSRCFFRVL